MTPAVALWPGTSGFASRDLLGRPLWERTLAAARVLGSRRTLWLGPPLPDHPPGLELADPRRLPLRSDALLVMPAELPCVTEASLETLVKGGAGRPRSLTGPERNGARVTLARASEWKRALAGMARPRLADAVQRLAPELVLPREADELLVVQSAEDWTRAAGVLRKRKIQDLLRRGVLVSDPESVVVAPEVTVGAGSRLLPWVHLEGATAIGRNVTISSFTHIVDSVIGSGSLVLDHCFIRRSRIGKNVQIGPFAHLRPDSDVGPGAKVGNFVELKNTRLGPGARAPHLSYLGDAEVGRGTNVGAGTITCNFDGVHKHRTVIGDGAFIGSDVQLVAPVRVGKGAYVAAGSCIVEDVPAHALALARSRQTVKPGWARSRKRSRRS